MNYVMIINILFRILQNNYFRAYTYQTKIFIMG
jgi:hypothetical protein